MSHVTYQTQGQENKQGLLASGFGVIPDDSRLHVKISPPPIFSSAFHPYLLVFLGWYISVFETFGSCLTYLKTRYHVYPRFTGRFPQLTADQLTLLFSVGPIRLPRIVLASKRVCANFPTPFCLHPTHLTGGDTLLSNT